MLVSSSFHISWACSFLTVVELIEMIERFYQQQARVFSFALSRKNPNHLPTEIDSIIVLYCRLGKFLKFDLN